MFMEKPCALTIPGFFDDRNSTKFTCKSMSEMALGNSDTAVVELDPHHHNGFLLNGGPNVVHVSRTHQKSDGALSGPQVQPPRLESEPFKTIMAVVYCLFVSYLSAFTITYTHDRTPDLAKNPPLPDLVFEVVPRIEWAFLACEICMLILAVFNIINLTFHKHRLIIVRRFMATIGFAYTLRCLTMVVTSLSVTGYHVHCGKKMFDSIWSKLGRAIAVSIGLGMTVTGQRDELCGDYMYSGHTVTIMATCLFFTEYTPSRCRLMHFLVWMTSGASLFFIVAAHEHYTVDVLIAMIVTSLIFLYYHTLANTRAHLHRDLNRVRVWFPFFYYLESKVDGIVPNEYEWPFRCPSSVSWPRCPKLWHRSKSGLVD